MKKKNIFIDSYTILDSNKKIISLLTRYSNTIHDLQVWVQTKIYQKHLSYLLLDQYLLRKAIYTSTSHTVLQYKVLEAKQDSNYFSHILVNI